MTIKVKFSQMMAWLCAVVLAPAVFANGDPSTETGWAATWATASKVQSPFDPPTPQFNNATLRQIVRVSTGGMHARVWLTNEFGTEPLALGAATIGLQESADTVTAGSLNTLTFGGASSITIAPGARVVSDAVTLAVPDLADLAISIHLTQDLSEQTSPASYHVRALQTSYVSPGDQTAALSLTDSETTTAWFYLAAVDVTVAGKVPVFAAYGDSITDGDQIAALEPVDENARFTNFLASALLADGPASVINLGISGNQLNSTFIGENMQARLDRDVLTQTAVSHMIVLGGINDLGLPILLGAPAGATASQLIAGHQQIAARAKARGLEVIGGTLTPSGSVALPGYNSEATQAVRAEVNEWIRSSGTYDRVADFDRALRDPANPGVMQADLTADGLHPNSAGYRVMAAEVTRALNSTTVDGKAFTDSNGDGIIDAGEPGEAGLRFTLYHCAPPYGIAGVAVSTAPDGLFSFSNVDPGEYQLGVERNGRSIAPVKMGTMNANQFYPNGFTNCAAAPGGLIGAGFLP